MDGEEIARQLNLVRDYDVPKKHIASRTALRIAAERVEKYDEIEKVFDEWAKTGDLADVWAFQQMRKILKR